uniref:Uncharacterized protein n=1 Tax=Oryza glumipatula TaxID=40148 RepID=A0A0D9Z5W2_9ORYZ
MAFMSDVSSFSVQLQGVTVCRVQAKGSLAVPQGVGVVAHGVEECCPEMEQLEVMDPCQTLMRPWWD